MAESAPLLAGVISTSTNGNVRGLCPLGPPAHLPDPGCLLSATNLTATIILAPSRTCRERMAAARPAAPRV